MDDSSAVKNIRLKSWLQFLIAVAIVILFASVGSMARIRFDLTEDNRYTLSEPTKRILSELKNDIYIQIYLDGDLPIPLKKLKRSVNEMVDEFKIASGRKIDYDYINPSDGKNNEERENQYQILIDKGLTPINVRANDGEGGATQKIIFPGMILNYNGIEVPVNFLKNNPTISYEQNILHSIEGLEYELIQTISTLSSDTIYKVAFLEGQGEISEVETADITFSLAKFFTIDRGNISGKAGILDNYAAIVIAGPEEEFTETDKLVLDQYIMNGGKVLWLIDEVNVNADSLVYGATVGLYRPLNLEDQLFRYGVRINPAIVQDVDCGNIMLSVRTGNSQPQYVPLPWLYYPLLNPSPLHPITRSMNRIRAEFANYIDTVGLDPSIKKIVLLSTSDMSRTISPPLMISLKEAESPINEKEFNKSNLPVAVLLEGTFPSAFKNRVIGNLGDANSIKFKSESVETKMIVVADADIIRNDIRRVGFEELPLTLGQDKYTGQMYGNRDFLINCLNYMVDDKGIMDLRSRELKLRLLNTTRIKSEKVKWQIINIFAPILIAILAAVIFNLLRRIKYVRDY